MRSFLTVLLCSFIFAFGAQAETSTDLLADTSSTVEATIAEPDATDFLLQNPQFLSDADVVCETDGGDADVEGDADANACLPVFCSCECGNDVVVVNLAGRHGETCASVDDRPCNVGNGWFEYKNCK